MQAKAGGVLFVQFAKAPESGRVKTRMIGALSPDQALELHCQLTRHCLAKLQEIDFADTQLWVGSNPEHPFFQSLQKEHPGLVVQQQKGGDLDERIYGMFAEMLDRYDRVVLIGSDCPFIDTGYLQQAVEALGRYPAVLGPAADGGYVLIGLNRVHQHLFTDIDWGSSRVLEQTRKALDDLDWPSYELPTSHDIDRPDDLSRLASLDQFKPWLSFC